MKILILENDRELYAGSQFTSWVAFKKTQDHEIRFIYNAYNKGSEIVSQIEWPDLIAFESTFVYRQSIYNLSLAMAKYRKTPVEMYISNSNVNDAVAELVSIHASVPVSDGYDKNGNPLVHWEYNEEKGEEYGYMMRNINVSSLLYDKFDKEETIEPITFLKDLANSYTAKMKADAEAKAGAIATGRMVRIKPGILESAPGKEWSKLIPGMIVPELDMSHASERVAGKQVERGAWVMGLTEPVKLLNDDGGHRGNRYDEFEYIIRNMEDLVLEICKMCRRPLNDTKDYYFIKGVLQDKELSAHWMATEILDEFNTERRGHRSVLEGRIKEFQNLSAKTSPVHE